jgi:hypothetical protein
MTFFMIRVKSETIYVLVQNLNIINIYNLCAFVPNGIKFKVIEIIVKIDIYSLKIYPNIKWMIFEWTILFDHYLFNWSQDNNKCRWDVFLTNKLSGLFQYLFFCHNIGHSRKLSSDCSSNLWMNLKLFEFIIFVFVENISESK